MTQTHAHHTDDDDDARQPGPQPPPPHGTGERGAVVRLGIALASVLFIAAAGVLYLRWATMREPTCVFIVEAPLALRGAEVSVAGVNIAKPHTATIGRGERFAIPFYLEYGTYKVSVTMNDVPVVETEVLLDHNKPYQKIDLKDVPSPVPTTSGATAPRPPDFLPANDALRGLSSPPPPFPGGGSGVQ